MRRFFLLLLLLILLASSRLVMAQTPAPTADFDLVITNGHIVDGTGSSLPLVRA